MLRKILMVFTAVFLLSVTGPVLAADSLNFNKDGYEQALSQAAKEKKIVMLYFWADWCGFCKKIEAEVFADSEVRKVFDEAFLAVSIDINKDPQKLSEKFRASALPTLTFLNAQGEMLGYWEGATDPKTFIEILKYVQRTTQS